jgi:hypothetical protein
MKIDYSNPWTLAFIVLLVLILIPQISPMSFVGPDGDSVDSEILYQDGPFGWQLRKVSLDTGGFTYVKQYQWYHLESLYTTVTGFKPANIYGIDSDDEFLGTRASASNWLWIECESDDYTVPVYVLEQNDLDFTESGNLLYGGKVAAKYSRLDTCWGISEWGEPLGDLYRYDYSEGPFDYGDTWQTTVTFKVSGVNGLELGDDEIFFTISEKLYPDAWWAVSGYEVDRAWVSISKQDSPEEAAARGTGKITVTITDELVAYASYVQMYRDGEEYGNPFWVSADGKTLTLDLNHYYRFEVIPPEGSDWTTWAYDACPQQDDYDYDIGDVYLNAEHNRIAYIISGNDENTEGSGFDTPETWYDYSHVWDSFWDDDDGGSGEDREWWEYAVAILFGITLLGIPAVMVALLLLFAYKSFTGSGANVTISLEEIKRSVKRKTRRK